MQFASPNTCSPPRDAEDTGPAVAAYIAAILSGERRTQREVAEVAGVTEVTIRNRYKEVTERLDIDIVL